MAAFKYKFKTSQSQIKKVHAKYMDNFKDTIIKRLSFIGETFVKLAREGWSYNDITGNLRSSIGYVIVDHGHIIGENYSPSQHGTKKAEGLKEAKKLTKELATEYNNGYALIVVAGMDYAAAVESKGKDVITGSSLIAEWPFLMNFSIYLFSGKPISSL